MSMSSFAYQGTTGVVMGAEGGGGVLEAGVEAKNGLMGEGTVNSQHGTGVEGSLHPCV
jgi:hypothetical protein